MERYVGNVHLESNIMNLIRFLEYYSASKQYLYKITKHFYSTTLTFKKVSVFLFSSVSTPKSAPEFMKQLTRYFIVYTIKPTSYNLNKVECLLNIEKCGYVPNNASTYFLDD